MTQTSETNPRKALGRGLAALIPSSTNKTESAGLRLIPVEKIAPNQHQPRMTFEPEALDELAQSIKANGVLQPIIVRRFNEGYEIVAGERRWRAATKAGIQEVPCLVKELSDHQALEIALIENIQRQDLDPLEEASAYQRLIREHSLTQDDVAKAVSKSRTAITNALRLLKLPEPILAMLADHRLSPGHARALMSLDNPEDMLRLANDVVGRKSSVRETEARVKMLKRSDAKSAKRHKNPAELQVEERLMRRLGTKVLINQSKGKGHLQIFFHSLDQLDELLLKFNA
ncbi:MAG: ParB/RepB/Spo0J family partition protein [Myxococcota bacterium]